MDTLPTQRQASSGGVLASLAQGSSSSSSSSSSLGPSNRDQQIEKLLKEVKQLKQRVDVMDKENIALKKSIYDLSARYAASISQGGLNYRPGPFVMDPINSSNTNSGVITKAQEILTKAVQQAGGDIDSLQTCKWTYLKRNMTFKRPCFFLVVGGYQDTRDGKVFQMRYDLKVLQLLVGMNVAPHPNVLFFHSGSYWCCVLCRILPQWRTFGNRIFR
jgi:COMPASS component SWD3